MITQKASATLAEAILNGIRGVVPSGSAALHEPTFAGREWDYVKECLDTGWVSSAGTFVDRFETELQKFTGAAHAIAVVNGTAALHLALQLAGVQPRDEVIVPALSFVATANAVSHCGAIPHFADCETETLGLDPRVLRAHLEDVAEVRDGVCRNAKTGRIIRAIVPMHTFGHPVDLDELLEVAAAFGLAVVEDAAESLGSFYHGRHTGTFGVLGTLSFNGNKTVTTGGGGAILTNDDALAARCRHLTTTGRLRHRWRYQHDEVAYNYRLPNINAALGCAQLEQLPEFIQSKRRLFSRYQEAFAHDPRVEVFAEPRGCHSNYWLQTLLLDEASSDQRDAVLELTNDEGLSTRPTWDLLHRQPMYRDCPRMPLSVAESLERRIINVPSSSGLA